MPRAKGDYMAGYQRVLDPKRTGDLTAYLRLSPNNIVPGAIIVAVDEDYIDVEPRDGLFDLTVEGDERTFEQKLQELWGSFTVRLANEELSSAGIDYTEPSAAEAKKEHAAAAEGAVEGDDVAAAEAGEARTEGDGGTAAEAPAEGEDEAESPAEDPDFAEILGRLEGEVEDDDDESELFPSSYLATLAKELTDAVQDWDSLPTARQDAIRSYIEGVSKPGLIIDGQHRVFGAKNVSEHDVRLPVVLLPSLPFAEQVFQFYVLNSKARPLRPTELRRIVSTSLTNAEIDDLYDRFKAAGIDADEARWTLNLNTDPQSPFRARIDFGYAEPGSIIPENVADQVVRAFMKMPRSRYRQLIVPLGEQWHDSDQRLEIFFWFWNAIKSVYSDSWAAAEAKADNGEKAQLFMKVALLTLQSFILDRFVTALPFRGKDDDPPLKTEEEVGRMVESTLTNLPAEFFEREWRMKQIDTSEGRKLLYGFMEAVWNNQGKMHGNMALFRG